MTEREYTYLQERLSKKIIPLPTNKQDEYNKGILAAKSIIKEIYDKGKKEN